MQTHITLKGFCYHADEVVITFSDVSNLQAQALGEKIAVMGKARELLNKFDILINPNFIKECVGKHLGDILAFIENGKTKCDITRIVAAVADFNNGKKAATDLIDELYQIFGITDSEGEKTCVQPAQEAPCPMQDKAKDEAPTQAGSELLEAIKESAKQAQNKQ